MNNLLIYFALPVATIILSIILERLWNNYILVTLFTFSIYLIVAYSLGNSTLLVLVIAYTLLSFVSAFLSMLFRKINERLQRLESEPNALKRCACKDRCNCNNNEQHVAIDAVVNQNTINNGRTGTFRGQYRRRI